MFYFTKPRPQYRYIYGCSTLGALATESQQEEKEEEEEYSAFFFL
jgi:hypothetical protein